VKPRCPHCGAALTWEAAATAAVAAELAAVAAACGRWLPLLEEYVEGFRAHPGARLSDRKRLRLLREVQEMVATGKLRYDGQEYQVRPAEVLWGLEQVANRELTGLKNHNYLKVVILGRVRQGGQVRPRGGTAGEQPGRRVIEVPDE